MHSTTNFFVIRNVISSSVPNSIPYYISKETLAKDPNGVPLPEVDNEQF